jgi:hypothetical protein
MNRAGAERVFALVAELNGDLGGRIVSERWWLVWIVMGIQIAITTTLTQLLLWSGAPDERSFFALWGLHVLLIPPIILFIHRRSGGQRTATERYIWWIWAAFIVCGSCIAVFNQLAGLPIFFTAPMLALLAAFAFAMMAMVTQPAFLAVSVIFLGVMAAMSLLPHIQFFVYGGAWMLILVTMGLYYRAVMHPHEGHRL